LAVTSFLRGQRPTLLAMATNGVSAVRAEVVDKRTKIVQDFCTQATPPDIRDVVILAMGGEVPSQRHVTLSAAGSRTTVFSGSKFIGGGIDGFVLLTGLKLRKICEVLEAHQRDAGCVEIINGTIARLRALPYIANLQNWTIWDGEAACRGVSNCISRAIATELSKLLGGRPPRVLEIMEHVADPAVRTKIEENWLKSRGQHLPRNEGGTEACYVNHKAERIAAAMRSGKLTSHTYLLLQQENAGKYTFFSQFDYPNHPDSLMNTSNWPIFRAQTLFIVHQQWVLQKLSGFRHRDFQPHNIVMRWLDRFPPEFAAFWLPARVGQIINGTARVRFDKLKPQLKEINGHVPVIIDLSRSMFDSKLSMETMGLRPGCETNARIQVLADQHRRSRTGDMRRFGIYLAYRVCHALEARDLFGDLSADTNYPPDKMDQWMRRVTMAFDWRFITVTMNLCLPPREWVEFIARRPTKAAARSEKNFGQVSESFRAFVDKLISVQRILQSLLAVVGPQNRGNRDARQDASRRIARQRPGIVKIVDDLINDLNPYSDYIESENCRTRANDWQLPEKIIEWEIWNM